jgi:hypothetical protein
MAPRVQSAPRFAAPQRVAPQHVAPRIAAPRNVTPRQVARPQMRQFANPQGGSRNATRITRGNDGNRAAIRNNQAAREANRTGRNLNRQRPNVSEGGANQANRDLQNPNGARSPNAALAGNRNVGDRALNRNLVTRNNALMLRNGSFADRRGRDPNARALAQSTFRGRFADQGARFNGGQRFGDQRWRRLHRGFVIGWVGPLFWPYAYDDFVDYTFWPHAYDGFWPYAYDDVYAGMFGPYAYDGDYEGGTSGSVGSGASGSGTRRARTATRSPDNLVTQVCSERAAGLTEWPIDRITQAIEPNEAQRAALDELKAASARAVDLLQSACPSELPSTPTGRLAAMRTRLDTMVQAVTVVRPVLEKLYQSLSAEQKARFNALDAGASEPQAAGGAARRSQPDITQVCSGQTTAADLPFERIQQAVRLDDTQRSALDELNAASKKAADLLKANCQEDQSLTPPGRLAAMEQRLNAMLQALDTVQPALERFYNALNDEQKARFNQLGPRRSASRD